MSAARALAVISLVLAASVVTPPVLAQSVVTVPLHLSNPALDSYAGRQGNNTSYFGTFSLGTPAKQYTGCFDTGSADVWLPLSSCSSLACQSHDTFNPAASSTYQATNNIFTVQYATGTVSGTLARDTMTLGSITLTNQSFGAVTYANAAFQLSACDGLFGLGFPSLSQLKATPPFYSMLDNGLLAKNVASFWLSPNMQQEPAGEMVLGGVNSARLAGPATYLPVTSSMYWAVALDGFAVGSSSSASIQSGASLAVIDTGSTATTLSSSDAAALHAAIPSAVYWDDMGVYNISSGCAGIDSLPSVSICMGGACFAVPPQLWVLRVDGVCVSGFVPGGASGRVVVGVNFLRAWHSQYVYDPSSGSAKIGFAQPTAASPPAAASSQTAGRRLKARGENAASRVFPASISSLRQRRVA